MQEAAARMCVHPAAAFLGAGNFIGEKQAFSKSVVCDIMVDNLAESR